MYLNVTPVGVLLYFVSIILLSDMQIKHQVHIQGYAPATSLMEIQKRFQLFSSVTTVMINSKGGH